MSNTTHPTDTSAPEVDTSESTSPPAAPAAAHPAQKPPRRRRRVILAIVLLLLLALLVWTLLERLHRGDQDTPPAANPPAAASSTAGATPSTTELSPSATVVVDWVKLSYAGDWNAACQLDFNPTQCLLVTSGTKAYGLDGEPTIVRQQPITTQGAVPQDYVGVVARYRQHNAKQDTVTAFLVNSERKIVGQEGITSSNANVPLDQLLAPVMK